MEVAGRKDSGRGPFRKFGLYEMYSLCSALSKLGNQVFYFVIPLYLYQETRSALVMGGGWMFQSIPYLLTPWIGNAIDKFDKRKLFMISEFLQAVLTVLIPILAHVTHHLNLYTIYGIIFLIQTGSIVSNIIGDYAFLPQFSRSENNDAWNGAYVTLTNIGRIAGPGVAGVLVAFFDYLPALIADSISFLFTSGFALFAIRSVPQVSRKRVVSFREGFEIIRQIPMMFRVVTSFSLMNLALGGLSVIILFFMKELWKVPNSQMGLIMSLSSLSALVGGLIGPRLFKKQSLIQRLQIWAVVMAVTLVPFIFLSQSLSEIGFVLSECCATASSVLFMSYRQQMIPQELVGRANALIRMILFSVVPISTMALSALAGTIWKSMCGGLMVILLVLASLMLGFTKTHTAKLSARREIDS